jgi:hypothetical protein
MALYLTVSQKNQFWPEILAFLWPSCDKYPPEGLAVKSVLPPWPQGEGAPQGRQGFFLRQLLPADV